MSATAICALVLLFATAVACFNYLYLGLQRSIGVLLLSLGLSLVAIAVDRISGSHIVAWYHVAVGAADLPRVFLDGVLALLLFAGSLHVNARELTRRIGAILVLATGSVIVATVVFGLGIWLVFRLAGIAIMPGWCLVIGAILAPTDAVVVESLLRKAPLPPSLRAVIAGESLFNDGAALVMYLAMLGLANGQTHVYGHGRLFVALSWAILGGIAIGGACGGIASLLMRRIQDLGLLLLISLALVLGSYSAAEAATVSAPIAVVTAGLSVKLLTPAFAADKGPYLTLSGFWGLLDELLDTLLFALIGLQVLALTLVGQTLLPILLAMPLSVIARGVSVAVPAALARGTLDARAREGAVLTWAGLRGGISVALALTLPPTPHRVALLSVCYAVVLFSIVVQGLTMPRLLTALYGRATA